MRKSSILIAGLGMAMGSLTLSDHRALEAVGIRGLRTIPKFYQPSRKTVSAAALKRAAKKRRNMRARSRK